ncbi:hypothetical protein BUALT_Bualt12G0126000 [Buddleja alternifolia]|uniref:RRM domain-containing protein n=1 Tax=Buddleja alternifolia TaxID=168488 RepID=A0AAV6X1I5_9LAMI|nr:hypothetical protein BUALT_Bualt12G0126000 [Buddleja alternifolia]
MGRHRSRSRSRSPARRKRYDDRRSDRRSPAPSGLLVRNISLRARPEDLRVPFERFGPIKDIYLPKNYYTGEPRGFGFVKYRYPEDAAEAKSHLDRSVIGGREIRIVFAEENRKTPLEMRRVTPRTSSRGSHRRRSPSGSPRRRHHCCGFICGSLFTIPFSNKALLEVDSDSLNVKIFLLKIRDRGHGARDDYYSPRRSGSVSRSVSPRDDRNYRPRERSPRRSRSFSRSVSPQDEKNHRPSRRSPSPGGNGENGQTTGYAPSRSPSPKRNSRSPVMSRSRSYSPR